MDSTKLIGWLTFLVGVSIILFALYSSYNIFTGKTTVSEIFAFEIKETQSTQGKIPISQEDVGQIIFEQLKNLLPIDTFSKLLNLTIWAMGAGILIFGGSQIASLGIKLIKTNKV
ncbi:MAG: hypothetical protein ACKKMO_00875 [Candidatus Nealsonbacteria bacterium]